MSFVGEIEKKTSSTLGTNGVLYDFVTDFVKKVFLDHMIFAVTEKTRMATRGRLDFIAFLTNITDLYLVVLLTILFYSCNEC